MQRSQGNNEQKEVRNFVRRSDLYQEFLAEREEILKHKWIESEKVGYDIGFERALLDWIRNHRNAWRQARQKLKKESLSENQPIDEGTDSQS